MVRYLDLTSSGFSDIVTAGHYGPVSVETLLYEVRITLGGHPSPQFSVEIAAIAPATQSVLAIIGRDILKDCKLFFDGPGRSILLRY